MATTFVGSLIEQRRPIQICDLGPIPTKVRTHRSKIIPGSGPIMLKNDEIFWHPSQKGNASCLSWVAQGETLENSGIIPRRNGNSLSILYETPTYHYLEERS